MTTSTPTLVLVLFGAGLALGCGSTPGRKAGVDGSAADRTAGSDGAHGTGGNSTTGAGGGGAPVGTGGNPATGVGGATGGGGGATAGTGGNGATGAGGGATASGGRGAGGGNGAGGARGTGGMRGTGGSGPVEAMEPGERVRVAEGTVMVGDGTGAGAASDTFASVRARLGAGVRLPAPDTRSYRWTLSGGATLTVTFGNNNLDADDDPPGVIDDSDEVSTIAVTGPFTGQTSRGVGIGTARARVEEQAPVGYDPPPSVVPMSFGAETGALARYFSLGMLVAYGADDRVRAVTICRAYNSEPAGTIDVARVRVNLPGAATLTGMDGLLPGSNEALVLNALGDPDGIGPSVTGPRAPAGGLHAWSYSVLGIEVQFPTSRNAYFVTLRPPFYGTVMNSDAALGSPRSAVEAAIGLGAGTPSAGDAAVLCYSSSAGLRVAVRYGAGADPPAMEIVLPPLVVCP